MKIIDIKVLKSKREVRIYFEDDQTAVIYPFGRYVLYSKVSYRIPKSSLAAIKKAIEKSEYFTDITAKVVPLHQWRGLQNILKQFIGKTVESYKA